MAPITLTPPLEGQGIQPATTTTRSFAILAVLGLVAGVAALWGLLFLVIPPAAQDFPLNDDWAFTRGAIDFARGDGFHYFGWSSMPQLGQWLWAWPFLQLLGESPLATRLATIVLSLVGVLAFFDLLRQGGLSPGRAAFVAACLACNPLYFVLSGTFLTDVPTLAFSLMALALYGRAFRLAATQGLNAADLLALAAAVAVVAAVNRQNAIVVPATAGLMLLRYPTLWRRPAWLLAIAVPAVAAVAAHEWLKTRPDFYRLLGSENENPLEHLNLGRSILLFFVITQYLGMTALPVLIHDANWRFWRKPRVLVGFGFALVLMAAGPGLVKSGFWEDQQEATPLRGRFPYLGNMLTPWGQFDNDGIIFRGDRPLVLGRGLCLALTGLACIAGAALLVRITARLGRGAWKESLTFFTVLHVPFLLMPLVLFDRYLMVFMPGALYLATRREVGIEVDGPQRRLPNRVLGWGTLLLFGVFSVALMHDWLSWNHARWTVGERALARGLAYPEIDGGFEWNSWHAGEVWIRNGGRYWLSFSVPEGTRQLDQEPYALWLCPGEQGFYLIDTTPNAAGP